MKRRCVLQGVLATVINNAATNARAQTSSIGRRFIVGLLTLSSAETFSANERALVEGLRALGYVEGQNIAIERRYADSSGDKLDLFASELVRLKPDLILAGPNREINAIRRLTRTIAIVSAAAADPVGAGIIESLARPGGNVTGLTATASTGIIGKRMELLKEIVPDLRRIAVLRVAAETSPDLWADVQRSSAALKLEIAAVDANGLEGFEAAFGAVMATRPQALILVGQSSITTRARQISEFALKNRLPASFALKELATAGLLITYGVNQPDNYRRAAAYVDKILRGAKPADLPVEQPTKFEMAINLKTAKAIGVTIPKSLLLRADEVIE